MGRVDLGQGPRLGFGGDYNPEQWDAQTVAQDIELMQTAGVNVVSLGIFAWAQLEPREGAYELEWLGRLLDQLHAAGIAVDLATATASPPPWLGHHYPETLPVDARGVRLLWGARQQFCPSSPKFRERATALVRRLAERFGAHPAVRLWHVGNEYSCHVSECFCPTSVRAFQAWLVERYGTISAVNEAWGTAFWSQRYDDFAQIRPPAPLPTFANPAQLVDWRRFCDAELRACYRAEVEILRELTPQVPVTTNFMGLHVPTDLWQWAQHVDVVANDAYPDPADPRAAEEFALNADLMRSLRGEPFWLMEQTPSMVQWRERNSRKLPGQLALWSVQQVARGADAVLFFQWRASRQGAETFHSGMVPHAGTDSPTWREVCELGRALQALAPLAGCPVQAQVGIVMDWDALWARQSAVGPVASPGVREIRRWYSTFFNAGYTVEFLPVGRERPTQAPLPRVIVVPELFQLSEVAAAQLVAWAQAGSEVILGATTGVLDGQGRAVQGGYLGKLREAVGVRVLEHSPRTGAPSRPWLPDPLSEVDRISGAVATPGAAEEQLLTVVEGPLARALRRVTASDATQLVAGQWAEILAVEAQTEVLAHFTASDLAGLPALTRRAYGKGALWYLATDLAAAGRAAVVAVAAAHARLQPPLPGLPPGVEAVRRGPALFLANHGATTAQIAGLRGRELLSGQTVTGHLVLPSRSSAVVVPN
ncbi:beta-galactosidase [Buchananella hordeovulneris]|uniref:beta-galactosidase n=1 Tax=Buchananella hordeovulneris TaxID=52770 RepID=UPI000F5E2374|nr:beta-galactosidase [Buchananella hordeovulneris]RRD51769.1 beta-galactosidase [Buchananella hordeovulneris]